MGIAASIARNLHARRQGKDWRCECPNCDYDLLLAEGEEGKLLAFCRGGCSFEDVLASLVPFGLLDPDDSDLPITTPAPRRTAEDDKIRIEAALRIYRQSSSDAPQIQTYLASRGIGLTSPVLRFNAHAPHRYGGHFAAMVAPVVDVAGEQTGVHMTFLKHDGSGKIDLPKDLQRECRGVIRGGVIRLAAHDPSRELLLGEGVETVMSAMEIFNRPGWSAVYAGNLKDLVLPPEVRRPVIVTDNDQNGTGQRNALAAKERWLSEGRVVRIVMPPRGKDFNEYIEGTTNGAGSIHSV